jgi:hypothetical protein
MAEQRTRAMNVQVRSYEYARDGIEGATVLEKETPRAPSGEAGELRGLDLRPSGEGLWRL